MIKLWPQEVAPSKVTSKPPIAGSAGQILFDEGGYFNMGNGYENGPNDEADIKKQRTSWRAPWAPWLNSASQRSSKSAMMQCGLTNDAIQ